MTRRDMTEEEIEGHRQWARENKPNIGAEVSSTPEYSAESIGFYPLVVQEEWTKQGIMSIEHKRKVLLSAIAGIEGEGGNTFELRCLLKSFDRTDGY